MTLMSLVLLVSVLVKEGNIALIDFLVDSFKNKHSETQCRRFRNVA
jgi:hypothetical protein